MAGMTLKPIKIPKLKNLDLNCLVIDKPQNKNIFKQYILPTDKPACSEYSGKDLFQRDSISSLIAESIVKSSGQMNFLISGKWGIGKTSILNGIERLLTDKNISIMWFSPWKYSSSEEKSNAISRAFLVNLAETLNKPQEIKNLYLNRKVETHRNILSQFLIWISLFFTTLLFLFILVFIGTFVYSSLSKSGLPFPDVYQKIWDGFVKIYDSEKGKNQTTIILAALGLLSIPSIGDFFMSRTKQTAEVSKEISPEQLEKSFKNLINNSLRFKTLQKTISCWEDSLESTFLSFLGKPLVNFFQKNIFKPFKVKKLVIFVDDLDRCGEREINEFLTGMKTFLFDERVYFVIAADIDEIKKVNKEGRDYLRKIIQIDWNVPFLEEEGVKHLVDELVKISKINSSSINIDQIINYSRYSPNPRKIKYYFRRTLFILNYLERIGKKYSQSDITLLYKLILLSDLDEKIFELLSHNKELYFKVENSAGNKILYERGFTNVSGKILTKDKYVEGKVLDIIRDIPKSSDSKVTLDWSEAVSLICSIEGEGAVSLDFIRKASDNAGEALSHLKKVSYDFEELIKTLLADVTQGLGQINSYIQTQENPDKEPDNLIETGNKILTLCNSLITEEYYQNHQEFCQNVTTQFFQSLEKVNTQKIVKYLWDFEDDDFFLNDRLIKLFANNQNSPNGWLIKLIQDNYFSDFNNFSIITSLLDDYNVKYWEATPSLSTKFISFMDTNPNDVFSKLESNVETIRQSDLDEKFASLEFGDPKRKRILELMIRKNLEINEAIFNETLYSEDFENLKIIIDKIYDKPNFQSELKKYIADELSLDGEGVLDFIKTIWKVKNINGLNLIDSNFLAKIKIKIGQISEGLKTEYLEIFISISKKDLVDQSKVSTLNQFYESLMEYSKNSKYSTLSRGGKSRLRKKINKLFEIKKVNNLVKNAGKNKK